MNIKTAVRSYLKKKAENKPSNPELWAKVQDLVAGRKSYITYKGKRIEGPRGGKGFKIHPCVPMNSEALTMKGWKKYEELQIGDLILTYNIAKDLFEWNEIEYLHFYKKAPLKRMYKSTTGWDVKCTPNHKWVHVPKAKNSSENYWGEPRLREMKDIGKSGRIITCAPPLKHGTEVHSFDKFSKYEDSWTEKIISMSPEQRSAFFSAAVVYDGHEHSQKTTKTYGGSQKDKDHTDAFALSGYLSGYNTSFNLKKSSDITVMTFTSRRHQGLANIIIEDVEEEDVWCPTTKNETWIMRQNKTITITGNSAYSNGYAAKLYKELGGTWTKEAKTKRDRGSDHGGLDAWFDKKTPWGDWVAITPVKHTVTLENGKKKTYTPGDIVGPCGISNSPEWKDVTQNGTQPLKCMARPQAEKYTKKERAELAKNKMKKEKEQGKSTEVTRTPSFGDKAKKIIKKRKSKYLN